MHERHGEVEARLSGIERAVEALDPDDDITRRLLTERIGRVRAADYAERACRFLERASRPRAAPMPTGRTTGVIDAQLLCSSMNAAGRYDVIGVDRATGEQFSAELGDEFSDYCREHLAGKNPSDREMPHVPLFAHYGVIVDLTPSPPLRAVLTRGKWLGNQAAQNGFELAKAHLDA